MWQLSDLEPEAVESLQDVTVPFERSGFGHKGVGSFLVGPVNFVAVSGGGKDDNRNGLKIGMSLDDS